MKATSPAEPRNEAPERPQPDPLLMRQQQLTQQLSQTTQSIMDLRQKKMLIEDLITDAAMTEAELRGRLAEIAMMQQTMRAKAEKEAQAAQTEQQKKAKKAEQEKKAKKVEKAAQTAQTAQAEPSEQTEQTK